MKGILNYLKAAWMLIIVSLPALASAHPVMVTIHTMVGV